MRVLGGDGLKPPWENALGGLDGDHYVEAPGENVGFRDQAWAGSVVPS